MNHRNRFPTDRFIKILEEKIDLLEPRLEPLTSFILPGGTLLASIIHMSRTISRRAEAHVVELSKTQEINKEAAIYLNRLSDLMFVLARTINNRKNLFTLLRLRRLMLLLGALAKIIFLILMKGWGVDFLFGRRQVCL
mgnify:CR=1 FL=1